MDAPQRAADFRDADLCQYLYLARREAAEALMSQAGVLARALFENLASVLALTEKPDERALIFLREAIKMFAVKYKHEVEQFGADPKWKDYLEVFKTRQTNILKTFGKAQS